MARVIIRADSSNSMGTGHIMRCLVLAEQFYDVLFAVRDLDGSINGRINYPVHLLKSGNIDELIELVREHKAETLIIDHYGIGYDDEKRIKELTGVRLFCLDDTYEKHFCDVLLNHNVSADAGRYRGLVPSYCELRCGSEYTLLRDEFRIQKEIGRKQYDRNRVFVAMGGADTAGLNEKICDVLSGFPLNISVITTTANARLESLKKYAEDHENIELCVNAENVAKIMNRSCFGIITPSVTANEAYYLGVPLIAVKTADNQNDIYEFLKKQGFCVMDELDTEKLKNCVKDITDGCGK